MKTLLVFVLTLGALQLTGCATLSENECRGADWQAIGYRDGANGYDAGRLASHTEACAEYGIDPDRSEYEIGRFRGLEIFCTAQKGLQVGRQGSGYSGVCPADIEPAFLDGYDLGRRMYEIDQYLSRLRQEIDQTQRALDQKDPPLKDSERDRLIYRLRDLERDYGRSESDLRQLEMQGRRFQERYETTKKSGLNSRKKAQKSQNGLEGPRLMCLMRLFAAPQSSICPVRNLAT